MTFEPGTRVRMTASTRRMFPLRKIKSDLGTVVRQVDDETLSILRDGQKRPQSWAASYWERADGTT